MICGKKGLELIIGIDVAALERSRSMMPKQHVLNQELVEKREAKVNWAMAAVERAPERNRIPG